jgi:O-antigen ligase
MKSKIIQKVVLIADKVVYWSMIAIPFVASFSFAAVNIFIAFMIFAFIVKKIITKDAKIVKTPINLPFAFLIGIAILSFVNSVDIRASVRGITSLLKYGFLILIIAGEIKDRKHLIRIITAILLGLLLASLDGVYQLIFGVDFFRHLPYDSAIGLIRLNATFPYTNTFAGHLALFLPGCVPLLFYYLKGKKQVTLGIITLLGFVCLIFTFSRSAIFGVWLVLFLMGLIRKDKFIIFIVLLALIIAPFLVPKNIKSWAKTTDSIWGFLLNKERPIIYEASLNMIKRHPVVGVGVNTYCLNYQKYKLRDTSEETANTMWYAHNNFLQMASEIGVIGLIIFLWLLFLFFSKWFVFYRKSKDTLLRSCSLGVVMGILAFLVQGLTETNLYSPRIATLFWFEVGLLMGILRLNNAHQS